jgi:hypothetical protein
MMLDIDHRALSQRRVDRSSDRVLLFFMREKKIDAT